MNVAEVADAADQTTSKDYCADEEDNAEEVPKFTPEEEMREKQSLTVEERKKIIADLCGLADGMAGLRVSTTATASASSVSSASSNKLPPFPAAEQKPPTLRTSDEIERDMNLLNAAIDAIPHDEKEAYLLAMLHCPDQVFGGWWGEVMVEMQQQEGAGGRGKVFDAKQTAKKMVDYWQRRYDAFGEDLAFKPMTLAGAMADGVGPMASFCMHRISPRKDTAGRAVVLVTPRRVIKSLYPRHRHKRAFWYTMECLAQDPDARRNGVVIVGDGRGAHPGILDPKFSRWAFGCLDVFPFQWKAIHCLNVNPVVRSVILPCLKFFMKKDLRNRLLVHSGNTCVESLAECRLPLECLPSELNLGGTVEVNSVKWIQERYAIEGFDTVDASSESDVGESMEKDDFERMPKRSRTTSSKMPSPSVSSSSAAQDCFEAKASSNASSPSPKIDGPEAFTMTKEEEELTSNSTGRKSDQRMSLAVVLCLRDPKLDKTDALIAAGFIYDLRGKKKINDTKLLDAEGVSLSQRKNQLRRRLKKISDKQKEAEEGM